MEKKRERKWKTSKVWRYLYVIFHSDQCTDSNRLDNGEKRKRSFHFTQTDCISAIQSWWVSWGVCDHGRSLGYAGFARWNWMGYYEGWGWISAATRQKHSGFICFSHLVFCLLRWIIWCFEHNFWHIKVATDCSALLEGIWSAKSIEWRCNRLL